MKYPDLMQFPEEQINMVMDGNNNPIFNRGSKCMDSFEKGLLAKKEGNSNIWERYFLHFEEDQEPESHSEK